MTDERRTTRFWEAEMLFHRLALPRLGISTLARRALPLLGVIGLLSCSESVRPTSPREISAAKRSSTTVAGTPIAGDTSSSATTGAPTLLRFAPSAPPLETYDTSFVVTVGKLSGIYVCFANSKTTFLYLTIPKDAEFFDSVGTLLPRGDTVRISVRIDSVYASVQFGPHGSLFLGARGPALLQLNYAFLDFGGRALTDAHIWYQPQSGSAWTALATQVDVTNKWLVSSIYHFSNYAIAY